MKSVFYIYAALFGRPSFAKLNKLLYSFALRGMGIYNYQNSQISGERWFIKHILKYSGDDLIVFDVGANIGLYAKEIISARVSVKKIYAFEPHSQTYKRLLETADSSLVQSVNMGLSDQVGTAVLYDRANASGSSHASLSQDIFSEVYNTETDSSKVEVTTVDEFCELNKIESIDLLKIDVEGYELNVLHGAERMLRSQKIRIIQFEFTQLNSTVGVFFKDFYELLCSNYHIYRLIPHGLDQIRGYNPTFQEIFGYQNYVCMLKK